MFASRSMARKRPSGVYSRVSSTVLSRLVERSPVDHMTYRAYYAANLMVIVKRVAARTCMSVRGVIHSAIHRVKCAEKGCKFSTSAYNIVAALSRRSTSVTLKMSGTLRTGRGGVSSRSVRTVKTKSRNVVFNCTSSRARRCVPCPITVTRGLTLRLAGIHGSKALACLHPSKGARIAMRCGRSNSMGHLSTIILSARRSPSIARRRVRRSVGGCMFSRVVPTRLMSRRAGFFVGPAKHFMVNKPRKSDKLAKHGVVISACNKVTHRNNNTFSKGSYAGMSHSTTCTTHCTTGGIMTTKLTGGYRVRLSCTVNITRPASVTISAFKAKGLSSAGLIRVLHRGFSFHPTKVVGVLSLEEPVCGRATTCKRFKHGSLSLP